MQTTIDIKPHFGGWKVFEAQGIEPYFSERGQAIRYAESRTASRRGEIRILSCHGEIEERITFDERSDRSQRRQETTTVVD